MRASGGFGGSGRSVGAVAATRRHLGEPGGVACESGDAGPCIWLAGEPPRVLGGALVCWREPDGSMGLFSAAVVAVAAGKNNFILNRTRVFLFYRTPGSGTAVSSHRNTIDAPSTPRSAALVSTYDEDRFRHGHRRLSRCVENRGSMQIGRGQTMAPDRHGRRAGLQSNPRSVAQLRPSPTISGPHSGCNYIVL